MIETVENFLGNGLEIDHLIEVDFEDFPDFIDAIGGITVNNKTRICAPEFDNFYRGFNLREGRARARTAARRSASRACARTRARRPRTTSTAPRASRRCSAASARQLLSPGTFVRLPLVSWRAPKTIQTDLRGPGLIGLAADVATGGSGDTRVLKPNSLRRADLFSATRRRPSAVNELLGRTSQTRTSRGLRRLRLRLPGELESVDLESDDFESEEEELRVLLGVGGPGLRRLALALLRRLLLFFLP